MKRRISTSRIRTVLALDCKKEDVSADLEFRTYIYLIANDYPIPKKNLDALDIFRDAKTAVCARKILFIQYYIAYIMHTKHIDRRCINACVCAFVFQKIAPT